MIKQKQKLYKIRFKKDGKYIEYRGLDRLDAGCWTAYCISKGLNYSLTNFNNK